MSRSIIVPLFALATSVLMLASCGEEAEKSQATPPWVLTSAPTDAQGIAEAKAVAKEGDRVVLRGIIGGRKAPITEDSPVFMLVDSGLYNQCTVEPGHCATPWDYCCESPEIITENSATVQLVGAAGEPITASPTTQGFAALDEVIVVGIVGPRPNEQVLTVRATGLYRVGD